MWSLSEIRDLLTIPSLVISVLTALYVLLTARSKRNSEDIAEIRSVQDRQGRQIQEIESSIKHLPDKDAHHKLELQMKDLKTELASMATELKSIGITQRRVEEYLLRQSSSS